MTKEIEKTQTPYEELRLINVSEYTDKKEGQTYLSWAWAWDKFKQACPDAKYEIIKNENNLPYFESEAGVMVYTRVTANGETHEMWLPVLDGRNKSMKREPWTYVTKDKTGNVREIQVASFTMYDVNKAIMRCLTKNIAMFGLGLYIFSKEDLPDTPEDFVPEKLQKEFDALKKQIFEATEKTYPALREVVLAFTKRKDVPEFMTIEITNEMVKTKEAIENAKN
jgi:hypothetical protein